MENKASIEMCANTVIAVMTVAAIVVLGLSKGFSFKTPSGHEFDSRQKDEKVPAS